MLKKLRIGPRVMTLIVVQAVILVVVGLWSISGLNFGFQSTDRLNRNVVEGTRLGYMAETVREELLATIREVDAGRVGWSEGRARLDSAQRVLDEDWNRFIAVLNEDEREFIGDVLAPELEDVRHAFAVLARIFDARDAASLREFARQDADQLVQPFLNSVLASSAERRLASAETFAEALSFSKVFLYLNIALVIVGVVLAALLGALIHRSLMDPIRRISETVGKVSEGEYAVRCAVDGRDELGKLAGALDGMLEDKVMTLAQAESENERLNDSVLKLLEAVDELSRRDLTVAVPVSADVTGPLSDAINKMAEEFARVLAQVSKVATFVGSASTAVNERAISVSSVVDVQRREAERTAEQLSRTADALSQIAEQARVGSAKAERTTASTEVAMEAVQGTLSGMGEIRRSIQETGKRIRRLGERSQEITGIVDIIGNISERTHMLALNASMQSAAAGEAGRGFGVVADEVQRLAESAREATREIGALVRKNQIDTDDTVVTMDKPSVRGVEGSRLAESAGEQMEVTRRTTADLVGAVKQVAAGSIEQATMSHELREQSNAIVESTVKTRDSMVAQLQQTKTLLQYSQILNKAVRVFKLPGPAAAREAA